MIFKIAKRSYSIAFAYSHHDFWIGLYWFRINQALNIGICIIPCIRLYVTIHKLIGKTREATHV